MKFTLIEGETDFSDIYNEFKQDFLNPNLLRSEIMKKFNLSENEYRKIRKQVVKETGVAAKPNKYHPVIPCETSYIHKSKSKWMIVKYVDGKKKFFGTYDDLRVAMLIRDELIKYNWDKSELEKIRNRIFTDLRDEYFKTLQNIWNILNRFHEEFHLSDKISFTLGIESFGETKWPMFFCIILCISCRNAAIPIIVRSPPSLSWMYNALFIVLIKWFISCPLESSLNKLITWGFNFSIYSSNIFPPTHSIT